jgi:hypothetical protein
VAVVVVQIRSSGTRVWLKCPCPNRMVVRTRETWWVPEPLLSPSTWTPCPCPCQISPSSRCRLLRVREELSPCLRLLVARPCSHPLMLNHLGQIHLQASKVPPSPLLLLDSESLKVTVWDELRKRPDRSKTFSVWNPCSFYLTHSLYLLLWLMDKSLQGHPIQRAIERVYSLCSKCKCVIGVAAHNVSCQCLVSVWLLSLHTCLLACTISLNLFLSQHSFSVSHGWPNQALTCSSQITTQVHTNVCNDSCLSLLYISMHEMSAPIHSLFNQSIYIAMH